MPKTEHLTPWKPGQSGNPSGLPKGVMNRLQERAAWGKLLRMRLSELKATMEGDPQSFEAMAAACIYRATVEGDMSAASQILDRACGKPIPVVERPEDAPLELEAIPEEKLLALIGTKNE